MENYFNYFTEVEECFQRCRGTPSRLSPVDWALIEAWKEAGVPLEAALNGVAKTFEKWAKRPRHFQKINGLGYCSQEVLRAAEDLHQATAEDDPRGRATQAGTAAAGSGLGTAPFSAEEVAGYLRQNEEAVARASEQAAAMGQAVLADDLAGAAALIRQMTPETGAFLPSDQFEDLERRLTTLEEKIEATLQRAAPLDSLAEFRREVERSIAPYRRRMTGPQIESLERQYLKKRIFEQYGIPRLSLFYL